MKWALWRSRDQLGSYPGVPREIPECPMGMNWPAAVPSSGQHKPSWGRPVPQTLCPSIPPTSALTVPKLEMKFPNVLTPSEKGHTAHGLSATSSTAKPNLDSPFG